MLAAASKIYNPSFADAEIFQNHLYGADIYLHLKRAYFCGNFTCVVSYHVEQKKLVNSFSDGARQEHPIKILTETLKLKQKTKRLRANEFIY